LALLQEKHPRGRFFLQIGPHAPADLEGAIAPGITVFRFDPDFPALLAEADLAITLAGYNTTWEIVQARVPAILLCKRSRYESQWDRALALVSRGAAEGPLDEPDVEGLRAQAEALLSDPPRRERMSAALAAIPVGDGVEEAAQALLALMRGPIPVLPAPPPCSSPCTGCPVDPARETPLSLFELAARGERRVLLSCSHGREASLPERMAEVHAAGLEPLLETTGRMALRRPEVRALIAAAVPARLLFFGLAKGLHDRASGEAGSFVATQELAGAVPGSGPFAAWSLCTARHGQARQDTLEPIDRHAFLHSPKHGAGDVLPAVAILRRRWLPYSEVFIHTEAAALRRHRPIAICREMVGERLPGIPVWPLGDLPSDRVAKRLARFPVAVAHAAFATCATTFLGLARALGVPLVVSARGHDIYREDLSHLGPVFEAAARVLARTEEMAADLVALGCPPDKVRVLPTGVDLGRFPFREPAPPEGGLRVVTVGRFTAKKGIPDALRAFAVLATAVPQARIHVLGLGHPDEDPAIVAEARDLAGRAPLAGRVELLPAVPQPELSQALARSHLFLCASRAAPNGDREGLPNAVKEAMAVGLPVVATRHSAIPGLLGPDGSGEPAGVLAPEADPEALGAALLDLAGRPEEWPALARVARRRVEERFDLRRIVEELETLYEALQQRA
jgi:glycosyltransferase involved in cell wall biosynthesis